MKFLNILGGDNGAEGVFPSYTDPHEESIEDNPSYERHRPFKSIGALGNTKSSDDDDDQLQAIELTATELVREYAEHKLANGRTGQGNGIDRCLVVMRVLFAPVHVREGWEDDISREEIVAVSEKAGGCNRPDLPIEGISVDRLAYLDALLFVILARILALGTGLDVAQRILYVKMSCSVGWIDPQTISRHFILVTMN